MKHLVVIAIFAIVNGCVTRTLSPLTTVRSDLNYKIGQEMKVDVGAPIFSIRKSKEVPMYSAGKTFTPPTVGAMWEGKIEEGAQFYVHRIFANGDLLLRSPDMHPTLAIGIKADGSIVDLVTDRDGNSRRSNGNRGWMAQAPEANIVHPYVAYPRQPASEGSYTKLMQDPWPEGKLFKKSDRGYPLTGSFVAELVYSGRTGDNIHAIYREYKDDLARPAFTQQLSYNLKESKLIGFRSVKIRVLSSSNSQLRFQVIDDGGLPWVPQVL